MFAFAQGLHLGHLRRTRYTVRYPRWMAGKPLLCFSCALASLGDGLFGYSQGITAAFQVQPAFLQRMFGFDVSLRQIKHDSTGVNPWHQAGMVASLNATALFASLGAAYLSDILGRRISIRVGGVIYFIAAFIQMFAQNLATLVVGRCIQGLGVGILTMIVPIFQCEISPGESRGLFVCFEYFFLNVGYLFASWVGYAFYFDQPSDMAWRGPFAIQAALALVLIVMSFFLPETPRWLIRHGFKTEGLWTLADLQGGGDITNPRVTEVYDEILDTLEFEELREGQQATWKELITRYPRRTTVAVTAQMFSQLNGINAILHFLPEVLDHAGYSIQRSLLYSAACAFSYCAGTIPAALYIDKLGRRIFLLTGSVGLAIALAVVGGLQFHVNTIHQGSPRAGVSHGIFTAVALYLFIYGATWGPTPMLLGAELFPLRARSKGVALANVSSWGSEFVVAFVAPPLFSKYAGQFYFILVAFCVLSFFVVWFRYPETAHCPLEELGEIFGDLPPPRRTKSTAVGGGMMSRSSMGASAMISRSVPGVGGGSTRGGSSGSATDVDVEGGKSDVVEKLTSSSSAELRQRLPKEEA